MYFVFVLLCILDDISFVDVQLFLILLLLRQVSLKLSSVSKKSVAISINLHYLVKALSNINKNNN